MKTILITGATSGIGLTIATKLSHNGYKNGSYSFNAVATKEFKVRRGLIGVGTNLVTRQSGKSRSEKIHHPKLPAWFSSPVLF